MNYAFVLKSPSESCNSDQDTARKRNISDTPSFFLSSLLFSPFFFFSFPFSALISSSLVSLVSLSSLSFPSRLEDIRDSLAETSYGRFLADHVGKLDVSNITDKMNDKLASEFNYIRCMAGPLLAKFMDFIT